MDNLLSLESPADSGGALFMYYSVSEEDFFAFLVSASLTTRLISSRPETLMFLFTFAS